MGLPPQRKSLMCPNSIQKAVNQEVIMFAARSSRSAGLIAAAAMLMVAAGQAAAQEKLPFTLNWKFGGIHGAVFLAQDRGYFAQEGIDPSIVAGDGSANVVNRLASGAYQIGIGDIASVVRFNTLNPDKKVKAVYNITPADLAVVTLAGRGITKPADLKGKLIGAPVGDTAYKMFAAFSAATGVASADLRWEHMAPNIREAMLMQGKVDAVTANEGTALFNLKGAGIKESDIVFIRYNEYGVNIVNIGVMANESFIKEKPETVRKVLRAINRGHADAIKQPKAALDALMKRDPLLKSDIEMERLQYAITRMVAQPDVKASGLGFYAEASIAESIKVISSAEQLATQIKPADLIDMSFLPDAKERAIPTVSN
jgi:NitT/TauT family transport system substrate-binding protein